MALRRLLSVWFVTTLALTSFTLANPSAAVAACYGETCNGLDPYEQGCFNDRVFIASNLYVARYYSPTCNTFFGIGYAAPGDAAFVWMSPHPNATYNTSTYWVYSNMWNSGLACSSYGAVGAYCA
ncbi:MAG TPA: hypothetical protein VGD58_01165 [Herpetosiphonaceae bacterium]